MKKAFSLAELLIVLAIMSMVVGTMKVHIKNKRIQADAKAIVECIKIYQSAITMYYLRNNETFPPDSDGKKLEEVDALVPYCPPGFKTLDNTNISGFKGMGITDEGNRYIIYFRIGGSSCSELTTEVHKQLKTFTVDGQVMASRTYGGPLVFTTYLFLKDVNDIYI